MILSLFNLNEQMFNILPHILIFVCDIEGDSRHGLVPPFHYPLTLPIIDSYRSGILVTQTFFFKCT